MNTLLKNFDLYNKYFNAYHSKISALQRGLYRTFGVMIAVAIVHGGVMPGFFSQRLYDNLCERETPAPTLGDISDPELQKKLRKVCQFFTVYISIPNLSIA